MSSNDDVSRWIEQMADGDPDAATALWQKYFSQLAAFARRKLRDMPRRSFDEEDVALSAMFSFCRGLEAGRFAQLQGRDELWRLLVTITARKIFAQRRRGMTQKRGAGAVRGESVFQQAGFSAEADDGLANILGREPSPELANMLIEDTQYYLDALEDDDLRVIAQLKLEGYSNEEIAQRQQCVRRTIERRLERIRDKWSRVTPPGS
jgi:RNA polymerase sigma factor (sigma-70 family)